MGSQFYGTYDFDLKPFDWGEGYQRPDLPFQDLIIYEMTVRCFTADASSGLPDGVRGTFKGVMDKVSTHQCMFFRGQSVNRLISDLWTNFVGKLRYFQR